MEEDIISQPISKKSRKNASKKKLDDLFNDDNIISETPGIKTKNEHEYNCYHENSLRMYVLSVFLKDLYGKIITKNELNKLTEQECENIYKICKLKTAKKISDSDIDGIVTVVDILCSKTLPIENKDKCTLN